MHANKGSRMPTTGQSVDIVESNPEPFGSGVRYRTKPCCKTRDHSVTRIRGISHNVDYDHNNDHKVIVYSVDLI